MRSLFLKIFLWFWLAMALGGLALIAATALTQPEPFWQYVTSDESKRDAQRALDAYEREGASGLTREVETISREHGLRIFVLDETGTDVTGGGAPRPVRRIARRAVDDEEDVVFNPSVAPWLAMRAVRAPSGTSYRVVFWAARYRQGWLALPPATLALRGLVVLLASGLVCYVLARSLTSPILKVRAAARELATGNLKVRVGRTLAGRSDELAELGRDFDAMAERIEALVTSQQRLLGDISHELRSPLARLGVALDLARRRGDGDLSDLLGRIELESARLDELIGELLVLNRLESETALERAEVDVAALVREIADDADFEAQSADRSARVVETEPCVVLGDRDLLRRAIENVTRNALRYTAEGTAVELSVARVDGAGVVRVRDRGPGVPDEDLPNLFRPFYRVAGARERNTGGVGLGLAITERAVALHGGSVAASNVATGGLLVELRLPLAEGGIHMDEQD